MFYRCKNLRIRDIFLKDCAFHSMRIVQCSSARFSGIHLRNRVISNNDGFHFISCEYMHVADCDIQWTTFTSRFPAAARRNRRRSATCRKLSASIMPPAFFPPGRFTHDRCAG